MKQATIGARWAPDVKQHALASVPGRNPAMVEIDVEEIEQIVAEGGFVWLDVSQRDESTIDRLGERFGYDPAAIEDVLDIEQLPKFDNYGDHLFVVLHALIAEADRLDTHEVDCFLDSQMLVTVHSQAIPGIDWLWQAVQEHAHMADHGPDEILAQLAEVMGRRYIEVITALERRVDDLAEPALAADSGVLADVQALRRDESTIRRVLRPQRLVLGSLRANAGRHFDGESLKLLVDAYDIHDLVVQTLESTRGLLTDTLDTYRGAAGERQAQAATLLTVYAAVLLPLSLIAGFYGMNVRNLPGAEQSWGVYLVLGLMVVFALGSWATFIRAGLVGRPRSGASRRLVGGLAEVARAPVRPLTMLRPRPKRDEPTE